MTEKKSFLIIRYSSLGDVVLSTVAVENIASQIPGAQISFLTKSIYSDVFKNNPHIQEILFRPPFFQRFNYILDLDSSLRSFLHKIPVYADNRLRYNKAACARRAFLVKRIFSPSLKKDVVCRYLEPLEKAGIKTPISSPKIYLTDSELKKSSGMVKRDSFIAMAPGARWKTKEWPVENYVSLSLRIIRELGKDIVLLGDANDKEVCGEIRKGTGTLKKHLVDLSGKTSIRSLAAIIKKASLLLTVDSAPLHIARAVGTSAAAIFGPTVEEFGFMPRENNIAVLEKKLQCRPCSLHGSGSCRFKDRACMVRVEPYEVFDKIKELLNV